MVQWPQAPHGPSGPQGPQGATQRCPQAGNGQGRQEPQGEMGPAIATAPGCSTVGTYAGMYVAPYMSLQTP